MAGRTVTHPTFTIRESRDPVAPVLPDARLTVAQAAAEAAVSEHTIRRAYVHGHLPVHRFGLGARSLRITRRELLAWLEAGGQTAPRTGTTR